MKTNSKKNKFIIFFTCVICVIITGIWFVLLGVFIGDILWPDYTEKMLTMLNEKSEFKASEVFKFKFDRAYVFLDDEYYYDGKSFAEEHDLDISIDEVESGANEGVRRIVFVDEKGEFVFCYTFSISDLQLCEYGMVMYPDTIIKKHEELPNGPVIFEICSTDYYYSDDDTETP